MKLLYVIADKVDPIESEGNPLSPRSRHWVPVVGLCVLLIFAVLAFGAVEEWATLIFEAGAAVLFLMWAAKQAVAKELDLSKNPLYLPALLFFALIVLQIVLGRSRYAYVSRYEALEYVSYGMVLLIAAECVREQDSRKVFAVVMMVFGALYAFFALAQDLTSNSKIFWVRSIRFSGGIYGSYVNHDHYAGLMEMLVPIPLVLSLGRVLKGGQRVLAAFCTVLMASTIFLSRSRGGMIAFVVEIAFFLVLAFGRRRSPRAAFGSLAVCAVVLGFLVFLGKGQVLDRLGDLSPGTRLNMTKDSLRMFTHRPILGWGLGTFPTIYPSSRSFYTNLFINEAHNDYAQLLVETGLVGFALMLWFLQRLYQRGLPTSRRWEFRWDAALSVAALLGCTGILIHSLVDFNLQIPANAALFYVLCALAACELSPESRRPRRNQTATQPIREPSAVD